MTEVRPPLSDTGAAFAIGALVGVGLVMLLGSGSEDRMDRTIRFLREEGVRARPASGRLARDLRRIVAYTREIDEVERS